MKTSSLFILSLCLLVSCFNVNRLTVEDFGWMPYEENQVLVFKSNLGGVDTIFLLEKDTIYGYPEAQKINGVVTEHLVISSLRTDSIKDGYRYLRKRFFSIFRNSDDQVMLNIRLTTKDAWFYTNGQFITVDDLTDHGFSTVNTTYRKYEDVFVFTGDENYSQRSHFVTKLYWSKSSGLIRYDKKDGEYWELVDKNY
jgi:hypothetical protein